jgi:hypothetical protein
MGFLYQTRQEERITYAPGARVEREVARGNLIRGVKLLLKGTVNIITAAASNAPAFQVFNLIDTLEIRRGSTVVQRLDGQKLAALFTNRNGIASATNLALAGTVASNVNFQHYVNVPFAPDDALIPEDYLMDTRTHAYTITVIWKDITAIGTVFGTNSANVQVVSNQNIALQMEYEVVEPVNVIGPDGQPIVEKYNSGRRPYMRGLELASTDVAQSNKLIIPFPLDTTVRAVYLYATEVTNNVEVGRNTVLTGDIEIYNTNNRQVHTTRAELVRENTSQLLGLGSAIPDGLYKLDLTGFGNLTDALRDVESSRFRIRFDATKLAGVTKVHAVFDTVVMQ